MLFCELTVTGRLTMGCRALVHTYWPGHFMFVSYRKCFGRMNENSYITHEKPPHKTMRVHSTQKRDAGLSGLFVLITKDSPPLPTRCPPNAPYPPKLLQHTPFLDRRSNDRIFWNSWCFFDLCCSSCSSSFTTVCERMRRSPAVRLHVGNSSVAQCCLL